MAKQAKIVEQEKAPQGIIINQITVNRVNRQVLDVGKLRTAQLSADMDRWTLLYDIYDDLLIDGRLWDAIDRRIRAVTGANLTFQFKSGEESQEMIDLIDTIEFEQLLRQIMWTIFWRVSGIQLDFTGGNLSVYNVPRKHIRSKQRAIAILQNDVEGKILFNEIQNFIFAETKDDPYGLLFRVAPYVILMRGGISDWAQMVELFGMPQRIGKYSIYDQEARKQLEQAFKEQGAAASMVVPKETDIDTDNGSANVNSSIYKDFMAELKEAMLVTVLSNTMTTLNGSSRSQGEVHQDVEDALHKDDLKFVQRILNKSLKPILEARGYKVKDGSFVFPKALKDLTVDELISLSDIIEIPAYYFQEKYGLPQAGKGDKLARKSQPEATEPNNTKKEEVEEVEEEPANKKEEKEPKKPKEAKEKEIKLGDKDRKLLERFFDFFVNARTMGSRALSALNLNDKSTNNTESIAKITGIDIDKLIEQAIKEVYGNKGENEVVNKHLFQSNFKPLEIAINRELNNVVDSEFIRQFRTNTAVFSAFKAHQHSKAIADLLIDEKGKLKPFYKFKKEALQISKKWKESWLQTEYQMAVRQARLAANLKEWEKNLDVYPNLEYIETTSSEPDHKHLTYVGTVLPFHHPWMKAHMPPSRWGCQCSVRPTRKAVTEVPDGDYNDPAFANSVLDIAAFVDITETPYYKNTEEELREAIENEAERLAKELRKEQRAETLKKVMKLKGKEVTNKETGAKIGFTVKGLKDAINNPFANYTAKLEYIKQIDKALKSAEYIGEGANIKTGSKPHVLKYHYYKALIDGQEAAIVVSQDKWGKQTFYSISEKRKTTE
ncbi:MAG: DUF935 family protein [Bacteroidia bacterium]|nr:DUF935 family protein [Bacteroidia bacterium]